jgi:glycine cleavage system H lipoate-binding protein
MFGLFQEKLGEVVYVQLPEVGTEVELDGKK